MAIPVFVVNGGAHAADLNFLLAPPRAILRQTVAQSIATSTDTVVNFDTQDEASDCTTTTGAAAKITINTAGLYEVTFALYFSANTTGQRYAHVTKNGNSAASAANILLGAERSAAATGAQIEMGATALVRFAASEYIQLWANQSSGGALNTTNFGGAPKFSAIFRSA